MSHLSVPNKKRKRNHRNRYKKRSASSNISLPDTDINNHAMSDCLLNTKSPVYLSAPSSIHTSHYTSQHSLPQLHQSSNNISICNLFNDVNCNNSVNINEYTTIHTACSPTTDISLTPISQCNYDVHHCYTPLGADASICNLFNDLN